MIKKTKDIQLKNQLMIEYLDKITTFCKNLKKGIINFWIWKKIIYEDRNWDQFYIYQILQFTLRIQAKYFKKRNFYVGEFRDAEIMELCDRLSNGVSIYRTAK